MGGKILEYEAKTILKQGVEQGWVKGGNDMIYNLVQDGDLKPDKGAKRLSITADELKRQMNICGYTFPEED